MFKSNNRTHNMKTRHEHYNDVKKMTSLIHNSTFARLSSTQARRLCNTIYSLASLNVLHPVNIFKSFHNNILKKTPVFSFTLRSLRNDANIV